MVTLPAKETREYFLEQFFWAATISLAKYLDNRTSLSFLEDLAWGETMVFMLSAASNNILKFEMFENMSTSDIMEYFDLPGFAKLAEQKHQEAQRR